MKKLFVLLMIVCCFGCAGINSAKTVDATTDIAFTLIIQNKLE